MSVRELAIYVADISRPREQLARTSGSCSILSDVRSLASLKPERRSMKRFLMTIVLSGLLAAPAIGGEIPSVPVDAPPPDVTTPTTGAPTSGDIPSGGLTQQMSEAALTIIQLVLGAI